MAGRTVVILIYNTNNNKQVNNNNKRQHVEHQKLNTQVIVVDVDYRFGADNDERK